MSKPENPTPSLLFSGFIYKESKIFENLKKDLINLWSSTFEESEEFPFDITDYYFKEMGEPLFRKFILFEKILKDPSKIVEIKLQALELEKKYSLEGKRSINIDPGYLNNFQVVITTFKRFSHRIYLGRGVYAHLEYIYKKKSPSPLPWTYPDFLQENYIKLFKKWYEIYQEKIKGQVL